MEMREAQHLDFGKVQAGTWTHWQQGQRSSCLLPPNGHLPPLKSGRTSILSNTVAISHKLLLSTWHVASPNLDELQV